MNNKNDENSKSKQEIIDELESLRKSAEEKNNLKKEKMFFYHMFNVYQNDRKQMLFSLGLAIIYFLLINFFSKSLTSPFFIYGIVIIADIFTNISIALIRCSFNKEILKKFRKIARCLGIELFAFTIVCLISLAFL